MTNKLSFRHKFPSRTAPEVVAKFDRALLEHQVTGLRFCDRKLSAEGMLTAIVLHFLDLPLVEQQKILATQLPLFENLLGFATTQPTPIPAAAAAAAHPSNEPAASPRGGAKVSPPRTAVPKMRAANVGRSARAVPGADPTAPVPTSAARPTPVRPSAKKTRQA